MSLYSALAAGASGLSAYATAMASTADNVTNVQSVGYKGTDTRFKTLVSPGDGRRYAAGGVEAMARSLISKQGLLQASDSSTDMAIDGAGFFAVRPSTASPQINLTRAGSFKVDAAGYLKNDAGFYLQGWRLDAAGGFDSAGGLNSVTPVNVTDLNGTAEPTTFIDLRANLSGRQTAYVGPPAYTAGAMAAGTVAPHFTRAFDAYDAQGNTHRISLGFLKTAANTWEVEVYAPAADVTQSGGVIATGTVKFNPDGSLDRAGSTPALFAPLTISYTNGAGSAPLTLGLGEDGGIDGLTQYGSESGLLASRIDGAMLSAVVSVQVTKEGVVSAVFGNGTIRNLYQLPVVTVPNADGLKREGGNTFTVTPESGNYAVNPAGLAGSGLIASGSLEASNVDLGEQFTKMITIQRAYSASGKIIQTSDEMLQELSQLKR